MCQVDTKMKTEALIPLVENQTCQKANRPTWRHPYAIISVVLLLVFAALCVLTLQSVWEMRKLETTVSDLEQRLLQIEEVCRTRRESLCREDDDDDDMDDDELSMLPTGSLEDAVLKLPARFLGDSETTSPANSSDISAISLPEAVAIYDGRRKRAAGPEDNKPKKKPDKKGKQKTRRTAAHFHLNMPGSDTQFYQSVNENVLSPWMANQHKKRSMNLPYEFIPGHKGIIVSRKGLYLIYTQVTFHNNAPHNIAAINVNGIHVAQCTQSTHKTKMDTASNGMFANCFTAVVRYLEKDSTVQIQSLYRNRQILTRPKNTFFGLVKLA